MSNLSSLTELTSADDNDLLYIVDISANAGSKSKKIKKSNLVSSGGAAVNIKAAQISTGSASDTTASSGLSVTITPSTSSKKILLEVTGGRAYAINANYPSIFIYRGSTNVASDVVLTNNNASGISNQVSFKYIDSPASASAVTYTVYWNKTGNAFVRATDTPLVLVATEID